MGTGDVVAIDASTPDLLAAAQVAIGMLGVMTEVEIEVVPRYRLAQRIEWVERRLAEWDERIARHRHFSCFWCPEPESAGLYGLERDDGGRTADMVWVKMLDEVGDNGDGGGRRAGRPRLPAVSVGPFEPNFHELEYFVHIDRAARRWSRCAS